MPGRSRHAVYTILFYYQSCHDLDWWSYRCPRCDVVRRVDTGDSTFYPDRLHCGACGTCYHRVGDVEKSTGVDYRCEYPLPTRYKILTG